MEWPIALKCYANCPKIRSWFKDFVADFSLAARFGSKRTVKCEFEMLLLPQAARLRLNKSRLMTDFAKKKQGLRLAVEYASDLISV
ncbi:hypothetical protein [Phyllobacterium salinisoli]|uniref:hypothetical protein n=1 Tax=Phyllobacterium salinisoli TaxID=1899321 RepID=UPI0011C06F05|nr:hypothetical protein [Phyllobacterium salinisoli]